MTITIDAIKNAAAVIAFAALLWGYFRKLATFLDRQKKQDDEIQSIKDEQAIITYGVLACLRGLKEQGCDGPVTEAIDKIEKHLNKEAHR